LKLRVIAISQLPPPIHGSTMMTRAFLGVLDDLGISWRLVDRRFSSSVAEVGKFSWRKVLSASLMPLRMLFAVLAHRPHAVVFFATNRSFSFIVDWVLSELLRRTVKRRILYLHTVGYEELAAQGAFWNWSVGRLLGSATHVVCLGRTLATDVTTWVRPDRISYVPNATDQGVTYKALAASTQPQPSVLFFSNLIPEKGAGVFVSLAQELLTEFPDVNFVLAGAEADAQFSSSLRAEVVRARLENRVIFHGPVTLPGEKERLLSDATVLVFPSTYRFEAQPLTIVEAYAAGTPVVAYDVGGIRDLIVDDETGFLVDAGDEDELTRRVAIILRDPHRARLLGSGARNAFLDQYTSDRYRSRWRDILNDE